MNKSNSIKKLAIFAASGKLSLLAVQEALKNKIDFIVVAFEHLSEFSQLKKIKNIKIFKTRIGYFKQILQILKSENVDSILLVGKIQKINLFKVIKFDLTTLNLFRQLKDYSDSSLLEGVIHYFESNNIHVISQKDFFKDSMAQKGFITKKHCSKRDLNNILWGYEKVKHLALLNIGQSLLCGPKVVLSLEAIEGTDEMIRRSQGLLLKKNYFIKAAKKKHNPKYDLPVFGLTTIKLLHQVGIKMIGLEAGNVLIPEIEKVLPYADKEKMVIYGV